LGKRKVHLFCEGKGSPIIVIEPGSSTPARVWRGVQDKIAAFTRVCSYDRAGYDWSDPESKSRTMEDRARELYALLQTAGERAPYVLLGHSYGGFLVRLFAGEHPKEVVGMVLVDASEEGTFFSPVAVQRWEGVARLLQEQSDKAVREKNQRLINFYAAIKDELASNRKVPSEMRKPGGFGQLGAMPLVVLAHNKPFAGIDAPLEAGWRVGEERLARLLTRGKLVVAMNSDHNIEISEPDLIVTSVKEVLDMAGNAQAVRASGGR
jgi:pimeloyl-ACP methyl ester carboxylesterase